MRSARTWRYAKTRPQVGQSSGPAPLLLSQSCPDCTTITSGYDFRKGQLHGLRSHSCIIDGEAVCCDDKGVPNFNRIRYRRHDGSVFLYAFDLIELNGDDLRREPLEVRKATLASVLAKAAVGVRLNEHIEADGPTVFVHACKMDLEGIVSKRKGSRYMSGRSPDWLKSKNPASEAVRREAEEDWGKHRWPSLDYREQT